MDKRTTIPEINDKEKAEMVEAAQIADAGHPMDSFMDTVFGEARRLRALREKRGEKVLAE